MIKGFIAFGFTCVFLLVSISVSSNEYLKEAWKAIENKNFSAAQVILIEHLKSQPDDSHAKFLYARTLGWSGNHTESLNVLNTLLEDNPDNTDYLLAKASVLSWQNKNLEAIKILDYGRKISPEYFEIWKLELTLLQRQYTSKDRNYVNEFYTAFKNQFPDKNIPQLSLHEPVKKQFLVSTISFDKLNNDNKNGYGATLLYGNSLKKYQYTLKVNTIRRFDLHDEEFDLSFNWKKDTNIWFNAGLSISSRQALFPIFSAYGQIDYLTHSKWLGSYQLSHKEYKSTTVDNNRFGISTRWKNLEPKFLFYVTTIDYNDITLSVSAQITHYFKNKHSIRISFSKGNELEYVNEKSIIYNTSNITLDGRYIINPAWSLIYAVSHHNQGTAYTKNGILSGIQYKF